MPEGKVRYPTDPAIEESSVPNLGRVEKSRPSDAQTALTLMQPLCQTPFYLSFRFVLQPATKRNKKNGKKAGKKGGEKIVMWCV
jgi:hypothetical protein